MGGARQNGPVPMTKTDPGGGRFHFSEIPAARELAVSSFGRIRQRATCGGDLSRKRAILQAGMGVISCPSESHNATHGQTTLMGKPGQQDERLIRHSSRPRLTPSARNLSTYGVGQSFTEHSSTPPRSTRTSPFASTVMW